MYPVYWLIPLEVERANEYDSEGGGLARNESGALVAERQHDVCSDRWRNNLKWVPLQLAAASAAAVVVVVMVVVVAVVGVAVVVISEVVAVQLGAVLATWWHNMSINWADVISFCFVFLCFFRVLTAANIWAMCRLNSLTRPNSTYLPILVLYLFVHRPNTYQGSQSLAVWWVLKVRIEETGQRTGWMWRNDAKELTSVKRYKNSVSPLERIAPIRVSFRQAPTYQLLLATI